jgi:hypothetical protein
VGDSYEWIRPWAWNLRISFQSLSIICHISSRTPFALVRLETFFLAFILIVSLLVVSFVVCADLIALIVSPYASYWTFDWLTWSPCHCRATILSIGHQMAEADDRYHNGSKSAIWYSGTSHNPAESETSAQDHEPSATSSSGPLMRVANADGIGHDSLERGYTIPGRGPGLTRKLEDMVKEQDADAHKAMGIETGEQNNDDTPTLEKEGSKTKEVWKFRMRPTNDDEPEDWWFASTAIPLLAATIGMCSLMFYI